MQEIARISQIPEARDELGKSWTDLTGGAYFFGVDQSAASGATSPPIPDASNLFDFPAAAL